MRFQFDIQKAPALQALNKVPEALQGNLRPALKAGLRDIQLGAIQDHRFVSRSGNTDRSIQQDAAESGLSGRVFLDTGISPTGPLQHHGTGLYGPKGRAFYVRPKHKKSLRWVVGSAFRFARAVLIKGIIPDPFLYRSADRNMPQVTERLDKAVGKTLKQAGF